MRTARLVRAPGAPGSRVPGASRGAFPRTSRSSRGRGRSGRAGSRCDPARTRNGGRVGDLLRYRRERMPEFHLQPPAAARCDGEPGRCGPGSVPGGAGGTRWRFDTLLAGPGRPGCPGWKARVPGNRGSTGAAPGPRGRSGGGLLRSPPPGSGAPAPRRTGRFAGFHPWPAPDLPRSKLAPSPLANGPHGGPQRSITGETGLYPSSARMFRAMTSRWISLVPS